MKKEVILVLIGCMSQVAIGAPAPTHNTEWYYEIGGASTISPPASDAVVLAELSADASWGMGFSCGKFDVSASFNNMFKTENIKKQLEEQFHASASGALSSIGTYIMQRIDPGLQQLFTNQVEFMRGKVELHKKSCEEVERQILNGENPFHGMISLSMNNNFKQKLNKLTATGKPKDIVETNELVQSEGGDNGIPWIHGTQGGTGQPPISMIGDPAFAGYNVIHGRAPNVTTAIPTANQTPLSTLFPTPADAKDWVVEVLGDIEAKTCSGNGCSPEARPGVGLLPKHKEESTAISSDLATLMGKLASGTNIKLADMTAVSSTGTAVTKDVLYALSELPPAEQALVQKKIADEVAMARTIEKALLARRMLLSGSMVPNVQASSEAVKTIETQIEHLNKEVENLLFEQRVRKEVLSGTLLSLLQHHNRQSTRAKNTPMNHPYVTPDIIDGAPQ